MSSVTHDWVHDARSAIKESPVDFFEIDAKKYWFDFLLCVACAYASLTVFLTCTMAGHPLLKLAAFPFSIFWLYRCSSMVHEVSHLHEKQLVGFKVAWNVLLGIPVLFPSTFFTAHHRDHHTGRYYGTPQDPEYAMNYFNPETLGGILFYIGLLAIYPVLVLCRFLFAPISWLRPDWREFTLSRMSSFTLNWSYERNTSRLDRKWFFVVELACCLRAWLIPIGVISGVAHWSRVPQMYLIAITILVCNQMRFVADHHFESEGHQMSMSDHILDSCNYSKNDFLTWLFFPFTIRFHALHHLFPTIPYHNLPAAHAYLSDKLPSANAYHGLDRPGWWHTAKQNLGLSRAA